MAKDFPDEKCPVCMKMFKSPKMLLCMHTFCESCIVASSDGNIIYCPLCSYKTMLQQDGISGLTTNIIAQNVVESAEVMTVKSRETLSCSECEQDLAVCFCCECFQNMCESCANHHKKSVNFLAHEISYKKMFQGEVKNCQEHNEVLKFFCNKCRIFICHECTLSINHSEHTFSLVDELVSDRKEKLKRLVQEAEKKKKTIESITLDAETNLELIKISNEKSINTVEENFQLIHEALHTHQLNLIKSINEKYTESLNSIKQAKGSSKILSDCINFTNEVIESRCKTEIIDIFENLKRQLQNMNSLTVKRVSIRQSAYAESDINQVTNIDNSSSKDLSCTEELEFANRNSLNGFHADPPDKIRQHFGSAPGTSFTKSKLEDRQKNIIENSPQNFKLKKKFKVPSIKSVGSKSNKEKNFLNLPPVQKIPAEKKIVHSEKTPPPRPPPVKILPEKISSHPPLVKSPSEIPPPRPANPPHKSASSSTAPPKPPAPKILLMSEENTPSLKPIEKTIHEEKCNDNVNRTLDSKDENNMQSSDVVADLCNEKTENNARKLSTGTPARYINEDEKPNGINENASYITHNEEYLINQELIGDKTENYYDFVDDTSHNSLYEKVDKLKKVKNEPNFSVKEKNEQSNGKSYCPLNSVEEVVHEAPLPHKAPPKKPQRPRCLAGIELKQVHLVRNNEVLQSVLMNLEQACAIHIQVQPTEKNCQIFSLNEDVIYM